MLQVYVVLVANELHQFRIRHQVCLFGDRPRLCIGLRIIDGDLNIHVAKILAPKTPPVGLRWLGPSSIVHEQACKSAPGAPSKKPTEASFSGLAVLTCSPRTFMVCRNYSESLRPAKPDGIELGIMRLQAVVLMILGGSLWASAQSVRIDLEPFIASGLNQPLYLTNAHDGTNRRFVVEQPGRVSVMQPGSSMRTTFLDITGRVLSGGERGLLGLAFHPRFASNRRFFVDYTRRPDGATVIAEYRVSTSNPNVAETSETVLLLIPQPYENHNGGMIEFGPDGYLYIGMGDGGSGNDPQNRAQNPNMLLGKILRIDVERGGAPSTNPYADGSAGRPEIYAIGLRSPWRVSFDRATGQLYVGEVGQDEREEVDIVTAGGNYGWRVMEGTRCTNLGPASCSAPGFIAPIAEYDHSSNGRCSITGGYVYRGAQQSLPYGAYVYGDYCSGEIFMLRAGV